MEPDTQVPPTPEEEKSDSDNNKWDPPVLGDLAAI